MYNGLDKRDSRIKHRWVTVFPVDFLCNKHRCRDDVERYVVWHKPWKMGGVIFIPLFQFQVSPRFPSKNTEADSFCYFSIRLVWWQINGYFWHSR